MLKILVLVAIGVSIVGQLTYRFVQFGQKGVLRLIAADGTKVYLAAKQGLGGFYVVGLSQPDITQRWILHMDGRLQHVPTGLCLARDHSVKDGTQLLLADKKDLTIEDRFYLSMSGNLHYIGLCYFADWQVIVSKGGFSTEVELEKKPSSKEKTKAAFL